MTPMFSHFYTYDQIWVRIFDHFQSFHLFFGFIFDKLAPPEHIFQKMFLNHYLVYSSA